MNSQEAFIHPSSIVEKDAHLGAGTKVWHFCHIMPGSRIGADCILGQNVYIDKNVEIGNRVKIQNNVSVYSGVIIEDEVFLGPSMVFTNVVNPRSFIERKHEFKKTIVRKGASIGANATILCGLEIGEYALIGAGTVVLESVLPYSVMVGNPARHTGWVSIAGLALEFNNDNTAVCPQTGQQYQLREGRVSLLS